MTNTTTTVASILWIASVTLMVPLCVTAAADNEQPVAAPATTSLKAEKSALETGDAGQQKRPLFIHAQDTGAVGDGKTDDSDALQRAFDQACKADEWKRGNPPNMHAPRTVVIPAGKYRITKTLKLDRRHIGLVIKGTGGAKIGSTVLFWDGEENQDMIEAWGVTGLEMYDLRLDGKGRCGTLIRLNSIDGPHYIKQLETDEQTTDIRRDYLRRFGQSATGDNRFERLYLTDANTGMSLGDASYICTSDMTFVDLGFRNCKTGFITHSPQNMVYHFIRPNFLFCNTGMYFKRGGFVTCSNLGGSGGEVAIRIGAQGINNGTFNFRGVRVEAEMFEGKRTQMLLAEGAETHINISSMIVTCQGLFGENSDRRQPMFVVKNGAHVVIEDSFITGNVARVTGPNPSWLQFNNCRFRVVSDPRNIDCEDGSGFEINNCVVVQDKFKDDDEYTIEKTVMIDHFIKRPKHMIQTE
ncbi:MAG: glycoside hydrolase family 55 protein [Kiritimatiellales bacterium]|nr:glycoside hydrolase family 55 protein [Kiritimatiellales bacterium]